MDWPIITIIVVAALFFLFIIMSGYVKAPPDVAYIISGLKKNPKILIGRAGIKVPFLERKDNLIVKQISVDIKTNGYVPTLDFIGVDIDAVAKIRVKTDPDGIKNMIKLAAGRATVTRSGALSSIMEFVEGSRTECV